MLEYKKSILVTLLVILSLGALLMYMSQPSEFQDFEEYTVEEIKNISTPVSSEQLVANSSGYKEQFVMIEGVVSRRYDRADFIEFHVDKTLFDQGTRSVVYLHPQNNYTMVSSVNSLQEGYSVEVYGVFKGVKSVENSFGAELDLPVIYARYVNRL